MHFGTKADEIEFELPKLEKLDERMSKIKTKKANKSKQQHGHPTSSNKH
jgi:hypothetical protein